MQAMTEPGCCWHFIVGALSLPTRNVPVTPRMTAGPCKGPVGTSGTRAPGRRQRASRRVLSRRCTVRHRGARPDFLPPLFRAGGPYATPAPWLLSAGGGPAFRGPVSPGPCPVQCPGCALCPHRGSSPRSEDNPALGTALPGVDVSSPGASHTWSPPRTCSWSGRSHAV